MIYSGFWRRFIALLIDALIIWILSVILIIPWFITPLFIVVAALYHVVFETSPLRATPGKSMMKILVVKSNGDVLSIKDSLIRFVCTFLSSALLCAGYLISLFTEKKQTLHDFIADTVVIDGVQSDINYFKVFMDQAKVIFSSGPHPLHPEKNFSSESLEELYNLHQKGILTDEEYKAKKEEYLRRL